MKRRRDSAAASELERLRARLEEAELTLEAIRSGRVDALIVSGADGERVFTLQGADHRYRRIVEGMTEGAVIVTPSGVISYANASFAELVATPLERVLGSHLRLYVPSAASSTFGRLLRDAQTATVTAESELLAGADRVVPVLVSATMGSEHEEAGVCLIVTNLTGAMREAEQRFQFVANMLPQLIWSARPDGSVDYYNRRWFDFGGVAFDRGRGWRPLLHPEDVERCVESWSHAVQTGDPYEVTCRFKRVSDGAHRWHLGRAIPQRDADGAILRWYGSYTDIEDERALGAEAARARDKAEDATRLKDEFLATLSHELRTPLNGILGWGRLLQSGSLDLEHRERAASAIVRNAGAQNQLIDDLLDVSRIVSGKLRLNVNPVHVSGVIEAALDVVRPAAAAKGVQLEPVFDSDAGFIRGDAGRLQQVVWNLLANAVKFTPRGGRVCVRLRRVDSSSEIAVSDTGSGISQDFLPYVFDRFRQQDGAITRRAGGLGLGLAIVKNLVELHGGTVQAESEGEGKGSTFIVRLPIAAVRDSIAPAGAPQSKAPAKATPDGDTLRDTPPELSGLKVLVVDDEADARDLLQLLLEHNDAAVTAAASAAEALEMVPRLKPDVIVSDIGMPGEDGYSFIRRLRKLSREDGGRTPAVALTAYARSEDRTRALKAGFQSHATKPVDSQELFLVIANLVGRYS
jgi:signal transduction histidine kinase/CheY-like chemotaxis protein